MAEMQNVVGGKVACGQWHAGKKEEREENVANQSTKVGNKLVINN